jgi:hypothetical protein
VENQGESQTKIRNRLKLCLFRADPYLQGIPW